MLSLLHVLWIFINVLQTSKSRREYNNFSSNTKGRGASARVSRFCLCVGFLCVLECQFVDLCMCVILHICMCMCVCLWNCTLCDFPKICHCRLHTQQSLKMTVITCVLFCIVIIVTLILFNNVIKKDLVSSFIIIVLLHSSGQQKQGWTTRQCLLHKTWDR